MELLRLADVSKRYAADQPPAVDGLSLVVAEGEIVALLGPSGCGKTTTLRLIAGFETPDSGTVSLRGKVVAGPGSFVPPETRGVGIVFQDYALFPHLSVEDNVGFGLDRLTRAVHDERALTGDLRLEGVLDEIELRAAVEIAKLEQAAARAA